MDYFIAVIQIPVLEPISAAEEKENIPKNGKKKTGNPTQDENEQEDSDEDVANTKNLEKSAYKSAVETILQCRSTGKKQPLASSDNNQLKPQHKNLGREQQEDVCPTTNVPQQPALSNFDIPHESNIFQSKDLYIQQLNDMHQPCMNLETQLSTDAPLYSNVQPQGTSLPTCPSSYSNIHSSRLQTSMSPYSNVQGTGHQTSSSLQTSMSPYSNVQGTGHQTTSSSLQASMSPYPNVQGTGHQTSSGLQTSMPSYPNIQGTSHQTNYVMPYFNVQGAIQPSNVSQHSNVMGAVQPSSVSAYSSVQDAGRPTNVLSSYSNMQGSGQQTSISQGAGHPTQMYNTCSNAAVSSVMHGAYDTLYDMDSNVQLLSSDPEPCDKCDKCCTCVKDLKRQVMELKEAFEKIKEKKIKKRRTTEETSKEGEDMDEVFNGYTKMQLEEMIWNKNSISDAIKTLLTHLFSSDELTSSSVTGKSTVKANQTPKKALDAKRKDVIEDIIMKRYDTNLQIIRAKIRDRLKLIRRMYSGLDTYETE